MQDPHLKQTSGQRYYFERARAEKVFLNGTVSTLQTASGTKKDVTVVFTFAHENTFAFKYGTSLFERSVVAPP